MKNWPGKRIGFTAVSTLYTVALCYLLVKMLAAVSIPWPVIIFVSVSVAIALGKMVYAFGAAAEKMEADHRHHLPQNWRRTEREPGCDLCPEPDQFVHCKTHQFFMCWECTNRHVTGRDDCVLVPIGSQVVPHLVKK